MKASARIAPFVVLAALAVALRPALADSYREYPELDRITPVPADQPIPIVDFARPAVFTDATLSPSGNNISALVSGRGANHMLMVLQLKTNDTEVMDTQYNEDVVGARFLTDDRVIYGLGSDKTYGIGLYAANVGRLAASYPLLQYVGEELIAVPPADRAHPLIWIHSGTLNTSQQGELAVINSADRSGTIVDIDEFFSGDVQPDTLLDVESQNDHHILDRYPALPGLDAGFIADKDGNAEFAISGDAGDYHLMVLDGSRWEKCPLDLDENRTFAPGRDRGEIAVVGPLGAGTPAPLRYVDAASGQPGDVVVADKEYDFNGTLFWDPAPPHLIKGVVFEKTYPHAIWFDRGYASLQDLLARRFPGLMVQIVDGAEDGSRFLVATYSDRQPVDYFLLTVADRKLVHLKASFPWIDPKRMQPMFGMKFPTRDGGRLDAYVTLPAGASPKRPAPLVVIPHDGDWTTGRMGRVVWAYDAQVQFLASRGYIVLQPNYRGSDGYQSRFPVSDGWNYPKMAADVVDATRYFLKTGYADRSRVATMGWWFGAYLAFQAAAEAPDLYKAAIGVSGIYDWAKELDEMKPNQYEDPTYGWLVKRLGDPGRNRERFDQMSPAREADRLHLSALVAYSTQNTYEDMEAGALISALRGHGLSCETETTPATRRGASFGRLDDRMHLYEHVERFLAANLGGGNQLALSSGTR